MWKTSLLLHRMKSNPITIYSLVDVYRGRMECHICFEPICTYNDDKLTDCAHYNKFHMKCLDLWLNVQLSCPLCRSTISPLQRESIYLEMCMCETIPPSCEFFYRVYWLTPSLSDAASCPNFGTKLIKLLVQHDVHLDFMVLRTIKTVITIYAKPMCESGLVTYLFTHIDDVNTYYEEVVELLHIFKILAFNKSTSQFLVTQECLHVMFDILEFYYKTNSKPICESVLNILLDLMWWCDYIRDIIINNNHQDILFRQLSLCSVNAVFPLTGMKLYPTTVEQANIVAEYIRSTPIRDLHVSIEYLLQDTDNARLYLPMILERMDRDVLILSVQLDGLFFIQRTLPHFYNNEVLYTVLRSLLHHNGNHAIHNISEDILQSFTENDKELVKEIQVHVRVPWLVN